jgi:hypothetical protein
MDELGILLHPKQRYQMDIYMEPNKKKWSRRLEVPGSGLEEMDYLCHD